MLNHTGYSDCDDIFYHPCCQSWRNCQPCYQKRPKNGYQCVAVYVEADKNAPYLVQADQSIKLDTSYLDADAILNAAKISHSEAIHPGYGFLSENAKFASSVEQSGLVWIGPSANVISQMGDKLKAKDIAEIAGLPTLSIALKKSDINSIGFPLLIKAAAGGGGKGMRVVNHADELDEAVKITQMEALNAFADDTVFLKVISHNLGTSRSRY